MKLCVRGYASAHSWQYAAPMDEMMGARIKAIRLQTRLGQAAFADLFDVSQSTVQRWENGSVPQGDKLNKLAEMGGMTVRELIGAPAPAPANDTWFSEQELRQAIHDAFPLPPKPFDQQAEYLADIVLDILALPPSRRPSHPSGSPGAKDGSAKGAPPRGPTKRT